MTSLALIHRLRPPRSLLLNDSSQAFSPGRTETAKPKSQLIPAQRLIDAESSHFNLSPHCVITAVVVHSNQVRNRG